MIPKNQDWADYVNECVRVSGDRIKVDKDEFAAELYRSTFGIKQLAVQLIKLAYIECRAAGRSRIEVEDLQTAYQSSKYTSNARDVEDLQLEAISRGSRKRLDLRCPFDSPVEYRLNVVNFTRADRILRVQARVFNSSATKAERSVLKHIALPEEKVPAKSTRGVPVPKATDEDLMRSFRQYIESPSSSPKKPK